VTPITFFAMADAEKIRRLTCETPVKLAVMVQITVLPDN
jgi:hypothetical protein